MPEDSSTRATRNLVDRLDAVEHSGKLIARLGPARPALGADVKALLRRHRHDDSWTDELATLRRQTPRV